MKHLGQRYVQHINRTYQRSGTLWEGRFRSCPVQNGGDLLSCYWHIELNPVRAGIQAGDDEATDSNDGTALDRGYQCQVLPDLFW
jgi:hypothetical protein